MGSNVDEPLLVIKFIHFVIWIINDFNNTGYKNDNTSNDVGNTTKEVNTKDSGNYKVKETINHKKRN